MQARLIVGWVSVAICLLHPVSLFAQTAGGIDRKASENQSVIMANPPDKGLQGSGKNEEAGNEFKITDFRGQCVKDLSAEPIAAGDFGNVSFGPTVAAKVLTYDLASKKAGFNTGIGAGVSMRLYSDVKLAGSSDGKLAKESYSISQIKKRCRGETFDKAWLESDTKKVIPWMSITPIVYATKADGNSEIAIQPAISVGFLGELINVGAGFNLSGPDKGHVFLLLSLGYGFKF